MNIPTIAQTIDLMKQEILADALTGVFAPHSRNQFADGNIGGFGDLHNYVDANEYGGFCIDEFADALTEHFGGRDADEGMPEGQILYMNQCQEGIHQWILSGEFDRHWRTMERWAHYSVRYNSRRSAAIADYAAKLGDPLNVGSCIDLGLAMAAQVIDHLHAQDVDQWEG